MSKKKLFDSLAKKDDDILPPNFGNIPPPPGPPIFQQQQAFAPQQSQMQMNPNALFAVNRGGGFSNKEILEIINPPDEEEKKKEVVSVIVTTCDGSSYDNLFREVKQNVPEGRVSVYALSTAGIKDMFEIMSGKKNKLLENERVKQLLGEMKELDPDCVLFNWECCSGCDSKKFPNPKTIEFVKLILSLGHVVMFSDFAVKALINEWSEKHLGKNPFVQIGECQSSLQLNFRNGDLNDCGIPQLETVGSLCEKGVAQLHCLGGTVVVGINHSKMKKAKKYTLQVLTVATLIDGAEPKKGKNLFELDKFVGTIGHASLKYGHWIELSKLDASLEKIEQFASKYGNEYSADIQYLKSSSIGGAEKKKKMKAMSKMFVQQMPSCKQKKSFY